MARGPQGPAIFVAVVVACCAVGFLAWLIVKLFDEGILDFTSFGWILAGVFLLVIVGSILDRWWDPFNK